MRLLSTLPHAPGGPRRRRASAGPRVIAFMCVLVALVLALAGPAAAVPRPVPRGLNPLAGSNTDFVMSGTGPGQAVQGFIANSGSSFDPVAQGYPSSNPTTGFSTLNEGFAGIIHGALVGGGTLNLYCIDIRTNTHSGIGYEQGSWDASNVPNVGYVARILNNYYPTVPTQPGGLSNDNQRAAAVQAAIWFFTDKYVLNTGDPLHNTVVAITDAVRAAGPLVQPPPPSLNITPSSDTAAAGQTAGPFIVNSGSVNATVTATGATMSSDAAGTQPIANGTVVPNGTFIWLRSNTAGTGTLSATATATYPSGNVYLYDGNTAGLNDAQRLILAQTATLSTTVKAQATFLAPGSLVVTKTITGAAAGSQGEVRIAVDCGAAAGSLPEFVIPAGTTSSTSRTYPGLPAGSVCTVTETVDGHSATVLVTVTGSGQQVTIPASGSVTATLSNSYTFVPGSLIVSKTITGVGAGAQGEVTITVACPGTSFSAFVIPAGQAAGTLNRTFGPIPAGTECTVTETADGSNSAVDVTVDGSGQQVTVPPGGATSAALTDTYDFAPGSLTVTKTITGPAAGDQGDITITVTCDGVELEPAFTIPAQAAADDYSFTYTDIPTPATCNIVEDPDGTTDTVTVLKGRSGQQVTIDPGEDVSAGITDTYRAVPGELVVNKTITGPAAGQQGEVTITVVCDDDVDRPPFVIAAGTSGSTESRTYTNIPAGTSCTVTETDDGGSDAVDVTIDGSPQTVTISAAGSATANLTDTYQVADGSLIVAKTIAGPSAGDQDEITIRVRCGGTSLDPFVIPAGATGNPSRTYTGIPGGTECIVVETADGRTNTVHVTVNNRRQAVPVPAGDTAAAAITDTYTPAPGSLVIHKTITGPAAANRGPITITVDCDDGVDRPDTVIPPADAVGTRQQGVYTQIPAGTVCTVTETEDGATDTSTVTVTGSGQQVPIPAGDVAIAALSNTYEFAPGSLVVRKTIAGPRAGQQGPIVIRPVCDGSPLEPFTIPAGAPAGQLTRTYDGLPAGASCTGTETPNGSTDTVIVTITAGPLPVVIPPGAAVTGHVTNTYNDPGAVTVTKTIAGEAAGQQGRIIIRTRCGDQDLPDFVIPDGEAAATLSRTYRGITPGTRCTVTELEDGSTDSITVTADGNGQEVTAPVIGTTTAQLRDSFTAQPDGNDGAEPADSGADLADTGAPALLGTMLLLGVGLVAAALILLKGAARQGRDTKSSK